MLEPVDFAAANLIVEFGPGTGAMTAVIAERLRPGTHYIGIELNPEFCTRLREAYPALKFENDSVANLGRILAERGEGQIDAIICGLPWASLPEALQGQVFAEIDRHLAPGGHFTTFAYLQGLLLPPARALRRRLATEFIDVRRTRTIWRNLPPAFAYICRK
jgi:phospholipid N-methyltransferase